MGPPKRKENRTGGVGMAEKDILEKVLLSHADVFADCVNTRAYEGNGRLAEADL